MLEEVLKLCGPYLVGKIRAVTSRQVAYYCLAEIFRAGATETGFIDDPECLPAAVNLDGYRSLLLEAAIRVAQGEAERVPWSLAQQALLYMAVPDQGVITDRRMLRHKMAI